MNIKRIEIPLVKYLMLFLNWGMVLAVTGLILVTTNNIRDSYIARDFLDRAEAVRDMRGADGYLDSLLCAAGNHPV